MDMAFDETGNRNNGGNGASGPALGPAEDLGSALAGERELERSLERILGELARALDCPRVSIAVADNNDERLRLRTLVVAGEALDLAPPSITGEPGVFLKGPADLSLPVRVGDLAEATRSPMDEALLELGYRSYIHLPHRLGDTVFTLNAISRSPGHFDEARMSRMAQDLPALTGLSSHLLVLRQHRDQTRYLTMSNRMVRELAGVRRLRDASEIVVNRIADLLDLDQASLYLLSRDGSWATCEALEARWDDGPRGLLPSIALNEAPRFAAALREPPCVYHRSEPLQLPDSLNEGLMLERTGSLLMIPLRQGDTPLGLLFAQRGQDKTPFSSVDAANLEFLGCQLGLIVESRRDLEDQERSARNFAELLEMSQSVASIADLNRIPEMVARRASDLCEADEATLFMLEPEGDSLRPAVCLGAYPEEVLRIRVSLGEGITGTVAARRQGEIINHAERDPRSRHIPGTPTEPEAILACPLISADRLVGVLTLHKLEGRVFDPIDLDTLEIFCGQAAIALDNQRLFLDAREAETRLVAMMHHMQEAVIFADRDGNVLLLNAAARRLLGLEDRDWTGAPVSRLMERLKRPEIAEMTDRVRRHDERNVAREILLDGKTYLCSISSVRTEDDQPAGEVFLLHNVSELKEIEAQLLQSSKMSAVGQLAAGVAHEFNNLIAAIYGYAQFMQENSDPEMVQKGVGVILKSSQRARELTSSLLTFSRRRPGHRELVDLDRILSDTLMLLDRQFEKHRIRVERETSGLPVTVADAGQIQQVLLNILINSIQAMEGGGSLRIEGRGDGGTLTLTFRDEGPGIAEEHLSRIFEPFFSTKGSLSGSRVAGSGLGLSTAYNIVKEHGGAVHAANNADGGAIFTVTLPVTRRSEVLAPSEAGSPGRAPRSLRPEAQILVAVPDALVRDSLCSILGELGHEVTTEGDPARLLDQLNDLEPDLLFIPYRAAAADPIRFLKQARRIRPQLPVVFLTSREEGERVDVDGDPWVFQLARPFRNRDLVALTTRILSFRHREAG